VLYLKDGLLAFEGLQRGFCRGVVRPASRI
jgi:hypothetical protein